VTDFQEDLLNLLWEQLGAKPRIWWDTSGLDGQAVPDGIREAVYQSAVMVPVMSIAYLNSDNCCPFELDPFAKFQHPVFPLVMGTYKRIVVVGYDTEDNCPRVTWPTVLQDAPFVSFCETTREGDRFLHSHPAKKNPRDEYWIRLGRAVRHLCMILTQMRKGPKGEDVAELASPAPPAAKPAVAWRVRWSKPSVYVRYRAVDTMTAAKIANRVQQQQCDVTYLESDSGEASLEAYLQRSDAEILVFGCEVIDWARLEWLRCRDIASQGRPKRLGMLANGECLDQLGIVSDFVVPLRLTSSGDIEGLDRLLDGLS